MYFCCMSHSCTEPSYFFKAKFFFYAKRHDGIAGNNYLFVQRLFPANSPCRFVVEDFIEQTTENKIYRKNYRISMDIVVVAEVMGRNCAT